jgi:hypothetical protein
MLQVEAWRARCFAQGERPERGRERETVLRASLQMRGSESATMCRHCGWKGELLSDNKPAGRTCEAARPNAALTLQYPNSNSETLRAQPNTLRQPHSPLI